jgi:hexosaminidase
MPSSASDLLLLPSPRHLHTTGQWVPTPPHTTLQRNTALPPGGYHLTISANSINLTTADLSGEHAARATLAQLSTLRPGFLPCLTIEDFPAFPIRGVMLDISRDRIPTMERLHEIIDLLASLKFNHLQLYTEHTFAYTNHEDAWRGWSPITADELRRVIPYAHARGIDLAANQNCFGHLASWLRLPKYAHLAETHGDWMFDVWPRSGPFSLCPTDPASLDFIRDLLNELLPNFSSPLVNIGCDETYDIGWGRSKAEVDRRGRSAVYLDFLEKICDLVRQHNKRPMFWGDIALSHPECVPQIPHDLVCLAWGYEADSPFENWCSTLAAAQRETWVCPGTSSWRSTIGRTTERRANINAAARAGTTFKSPGFLICDWGDTGHHQQWPITANALAHAAQAAWNPAPTSRLGGTGVSSVPNGPEVQHTQDACATDNSFVPAPDPRAVSLRALNDPTLRAAAWLDELGDADLPLREVCLGLSRPGITGRLRNQSALFADMFKPNADCLDVGPLHLWHETRERLDSLATTMPHEGLPPLLQEELAHTLRIAQYAATRAAARRTPAGLTDSTRAQLRDQLRTITQDHARLWRITSREGGLSHSLTFYTQIATALG